MNCSTETFESWTENFSSLVSVSVNVVFALAAALIIFCSCDDNFKKLRFIKFDFFVCCLIILSGLVEVFHLLDATVNFCHSWLELVVSLTTCLNVVVVLPTLYVKCIFKSRSRRQFVVNVALVATFLCVVEICRFFRLSENVADLTRVRSGLGFLSLLINGGLCSAFLSNVFGRGCGSQQIQSFEVSSKNCEMILSKLSVDVSGQSFTRKCSLA